MPEIADHLPVVMANMESVMYKEFEFHKKYIEKWKEALRREPEVDGIITRKHCYEIAKVKINDNKYKFSGISLQQMVQKVITTAYQCGIEVTEKRNLKPEEYSQILKDIRERDERKRIEAEKKAQEEAELRRKMAKERKATAGR